MQPQTPQTNHQLEKTMKQLAPDQIQKISDYLKQPASHALIHLELYKTHKDVMEEALIQERLGKARWQVTNQIKLWLKEL